MAENGTIARPYAQAVFEIARDEGLLAQWSDYLHAAATVVSDPDVDRLIHDPATDIASLVQLIGEVSSKAVDGNSAGAEGQNMLLLMADNRRLTLLPEVADIYDGLKAEIENRVDVVLAAAAPVDAAQQDKIAAALQQRLGREVNLEFKLDENLIGGARLQADDLVIDGSVRTGLEKLARALMN